MGVGKTTIGKRLAEKIFFPFMDLDTFIEQKEGKKLAKFLRIKEKFILEKKNENI